ncbi:MAG TPA: hypothetical protein VI685_10780 [Candidatus Angelobacter sp.]
MTPIRRYRFHPDHETMLRALLCALTVLICYQFQWQFLRHITCECIFWISNGLGFRVLPLSKDTLQWGDLQVRFVIACTFIDVFCGSVPWLWNRNRSVVKNTSELAVFGMGLFVFNLVRLELGFIFYAYGIPWMLAHGCLGGIAYCVVWLWIDYRRNRPQPRPRRCSLTPDSLPVLPAQQLHHTAGT